jgi:class 3 adenylate cyclase
MSERYPEERRLATVLFADVQGFTTLAEQLDYEEVSDLIKEVWIELDTVVENHGGYIDKHIGDAVLAVWGAPVAGEDDAERAVTAALAMQASLAAYAAGSNLPGANQLKMRIAINTGPVLAGYVGVRAEYTVMGDTVNVASRLQNNTEPDSVAITESTYRLVRGVFQVRHLVPLQVKGKTALIQAFVVEGPLAQPSRVRYRSLGGMETKMVGRETEMVQLTNLYRQSREASIPTLVLVRGEPGMGKSRLLMEFTSRLEIDVAGLTLLSTRGLAQTRGLPFFMWKSLWYNRFGMSENDPPDLARDRFTAGIQTLWGYPPGYNRAVETAHFIGRLTGLDWPDSPYLAVVAASANARVRHSFRATRELLCRLCATSPTVLLMDDLQWMDTGSIDLLRYLLEPGPEPLPLLILGGVRPGLLREQPDLLASVTEIIALKPLPVSARVIAEAYPSLRDVPAETLAKLAAQADGNPYFMEELAKNLGRSLATGVIPPLPESLHTLLQARLDSLSPSARTVALLASVTGRAFWLGSVLATARQSAGTGLLTLTSDAEGTEQMVIDGLAELVKAELAFPRAGGLFAGELEYIFKHSLLRDVAYSLLPHKQRRHHHLAVAHWLMKYASPGFAAMVADHFEQAGQFAEAAQYYTDAAYYAQSRGADDEAERLLSRARQLEAKAAPGTGMLRSAA